MLKRLSRTESRTAVPSMAALGCRQEMDLGRRKITELGPPWSRALCEMQHEGHDIQQGSSGAWQGGKNH